MRILLAAKTMGVGGLERIVVALARENSSLRRRSAIRRANKSPFNAR